MFDCAVISDYLFTGSIQFVKDGARYKQLVRKNQESSVGRSMEGSQLAVHDLLFMIQVFDNLLE